MEQAPDIAPATAEPVAPKFVLEDEENFESEARRIESDHAERREDALNAVFSWPLWSDKARDWTPFALHPLSLDRWTWWHRLEKHNAPMAPEDWSVPEEEISQPGCPSTWGDAHVPTAWSLLYLCAHSPEHLLRIVPDPKLYWYCVNQWAAIHCPAEKWREALATMRAMQDHTRLLLATPRPTGRGRPLGNAPSL